MTTGVYVRRGVDGDEQHESQPEGITLLLVDLIERHAPCVVIAEDFVGAGPRSREAKTTLLVLGRVLGLCEHLGVPVQVRPPQTRRAYLPQAQVLTGASRRDHATNALAHLLRWEDQWARTPRGPA